MKWKLNAVVGQLYGFGPAGSDHKSVCENLEPGRAQCPLAHNVDLRRRHRGAPAVAALNSILAVKPDQLALNPDPVRRQDADFVGGVGGLDANRGAPAAKPLQP